MCEEYVNFFKCFSHHSRIKLAKLLAQDGKKSVTELAEDLDMTHSAVSRHLNILKIQGLASAKREDQKRYYSLEVNTIENKFDKFLKLLSTQD